MLDRLINFHRASYEGSDQTMSLIWRSVSSAYQKTLVQALLSGDKALVGSTLDGLKGSSGLYGIDVTGWGTMERLAIRAGVSAFPNPEQPSPTENWKVKDAAEAKAQLEKLLGFSLDIPECFGFSSGSPGRFYYYAAMALSVREMYQGGYPKDVLEVGAGLCDLGVISHRWNCDSYTVIDLPTVAVMGAYSLSKSIDPSLIWMFGEPENHDAFARFYPSTNFDGAGLRSYDLIYNSDSLPEIPEKIQDEYLTLFQRTLSPCGVFVSINHESDNCYQRSVPAAIKSIGGFKRISRAPFMMRDGYIEEFYTLEN